MRKFIFNLTLLIALILTVSSCADKFISDKEELDTIYSDFENRKATFEDRGLFDFQDLDLSSYERDAMTFLYAYMPLGDITDHTPEYWLKNIRSSLQARQEMPWGKDIPEREFRHFVLPVRVNNESVDSARWVFYEQLKERVKGKTLYEAVLEVNRWCHENVIYTPSDPRTSAPLATVKTAYGRCGEESVFTVTALRSVGIPARQVYTPRWAHTDNNHAWVEAWVDGEWRFLGACEPEPVLDLGWFNAPASRSMLMHTKVFGKYYGPEEVMLRTPRFTEINVVDNYAPTSKATVTVTDKNGEIIPDAKVEFKLYNYAEFYTIATKYTDNEGRVSLSAGRGDLLVWASHNGEFGFEKISLTDNVDIKIALDKRDAGNFDLQLDIVPPTENAKIPEVSEQLAAENRCRLTLEDSIRNIYVSTFVTPLQGVGFARNHGFDDTELISEILVASRGNYKVMSDFLAGLDSEEERERGIDLLLSLSLKDLRDITPEVLQDNMLNTPAFKEYTITKSAYGNYLLSPRVEYEQLTPYKAFFQTAIDSTTQALYRNNPLALVQWINDNITVDNDCNLNCTPVSPQGVWRARKADSRSRDIFFVAMARALSIPAYIDAVTGDVKFIGKNGITTDVNFDKAELSVPTTGILKARYTPTAILPDPEYYTHFTLSRIMPDGTLNLLTYDEGESGMEEGLTYNSLLKEGIRIECGDYLLVTGMRLADGGVLATMKKLTINEGETTETELTMRQSNDKVQVIGSFDSESRYFSIADNAIKSVLSTSGRGYYIVAILGVNQEPTNHALRDIASQAARFEEWGRAMILLFPDKEDYDKYNVSEFPGLPSTIHYGLDTDGKIYSHIIESMNLSPRKGMPIFIIADTFNRVVFCSQGYTIGLGNQMLNTISGL